MKGDAERPNFAMDDPRKGGWQTLSTSNFSPPRRVHEWNHFGSETFCAMTVDPSNTEDFEADIARISLGMLTFCQVRATAARATACGANGEWARLSRDEMLVIVPIGGTCVSGQDFREFPLKPGNLFVRDLTRPWTHCSAAPMEVLTVKIPYEELQSRIDDPACLLAHVQSASTPEVSVTIDLIRSIYSSLRHAPEGRWLESIAGLLLDAIAVVADLNCDPLAEQRIIRANANLRREAMHYIITHLDECQLTIADVANNFGVTIRCLQRAFANVGLSPSGFLQCQRLDRAARLLSCTGKERPSVTAVAMDAGFGDAAHFSRTFARRFGVPPSRYGGTPPASR